MKSHEGEIVKGFPSIIKSNNFESAQNQKKQCYIPAALIRRFKTPQKSKYTALQ